MTRFGMEDYFNSSKQITEEDIERRLDRLQFALDALGLIPIAGFVPDTVNGIIFIARGRYAEAGLSLVAAIPGIGLVAAGGKYISRTWKATQKTILSRLPWNKIPKDEIPGKINFLGKKFKKIGVKPDSHFKNQISPNYRKNRNLTRGDSLDHLFISQALNKWVREQDFFPYWFKKRFEEFHNGGWNLIELPEYNPFHRSLPLNQWMGLAPNWGGRKKLLTRLLARSVRYVYSSSILVSLFNVTVMKTWRSGIYQYNVGYGKYKKQIEAPE